MQPTPMRIYILFLAGYRLSPLPPTFYDYVVDETLEYIENQDNIPLQYPTI